MYVGNDEGLKVWLTGIWYMRCWGTGRWNSITMISSLSR